MIRNFLGGISFFLAFTAFAGVSVDGAGDLLVCESSQTEIPYLFEGTYQLDYVLNFNPDNPDVYIGEPGWSFKQYSQAIISRLGRVAPKLAEGYKEFVDTIGKFDPTAPYEWLGSSTPLSGLDERLVELDQHVPENCTILRDGKRVANTLFAVKRKRLVRDPSRIHFLYYQPVFHELRKNRPQQFSYLMFHEYLWNVTDHGFINRKLNHLVNSRILDEMSQEDFLEYLRSHGIDMTENGQIIRAGDVDKKIKEIFSDPELCNWDFRLVKEFSQKRDYVLIGPGETKKLRLNVQDPDERLGLEICGVALVVPYAQLDNLQAGVKVSLERGRAKDTFSLTPTERNTRLLEYGLCDYGCFERTGNLQRVLTASTAFRGEWVLRIINPTGATIRINRPYVTLVRKAD